MGPVIGAPDEVAQRIKDETDLVEVDEVLPDVVDEPDVQLGARPFEDIVVLTEAPRQGYGQLVSIIADYAKKAPRPFEMIVTDNDGIAHAFPDHTDPNERSIGDHLKLAYYGEPGDRRPLVRSGEGSRPE